MKPVPLEVTMMKRIGELNAEVANLKSTADQSEAEVDRLEAVIESHKDAGLRILAMLDEERRLTKHLKAEVDRLTDAGYKMLSEWASGDEKDSKNFLKALVIWNAAKEGETK